MEFNKKAATTAAIALMFQPVIVSATEENTVVVTANRISQDINDILTDVEIIDRTDIERIQPQSLTDLLTNVAGIDFVQSGGYGQPATVFVRGANSNQVLFLIDGIRVGDATTGTKTISSIPTSLIEKIEIVKGPRAALWGSDAVGGVIHIFTRRYQEGEFRVGVTAGSESTYDVDLAVGFGSQRFANTLTYNHRESDGIDALMDAETDKDGYSNDSLALRGDYQLTDRGLLDWVIQWDQGDVDFDSSFGGNQSEYDNRFWNLRYTHESGDWLNQFALKSSDDNSITFGNGTAKSDALAFDTQRQQFNYLASFSANDQWTFSGGLDWFDDDVSGSSTGFVVQERESQSVFVAANHVGEKWLADMAVRYDDVEKVSTQTTINLGLGYRFNASHLLSLNYGEGFKAPTFNDLYFPPPFSGNPDLDFETSDNIELVYKGSYAHSQLNVSLYQSEIENLIEWIPDANFVFTPQNFGKVEVEGIDATFAVTAGDFRHSFSASYISSEDVATGEQLIRRAKEHFGYDLVYAASKWDWYAQLEYTGERPDTDFTAFVPVTLDAYTRVNIGTSYYAGNNWRWQLKVADLFDEAPTQVHNYNALGRQYYLTLSYQNVK